MGGFVKTNGGIWVPPNTLGLDSAIGTEEVKEAGEGKGIKNLRQLQMTVFRELKRLKDDKPDAVAAALRGILFKDSFTLRWELVGKAPLAVARSLELPEGTQLDVYQEQQRHNLQDMLVCKVPDAVAPTLERDDSDAAWELRDKMMKGRIYSNVLRSLIGVGSKRAEKLLDALKDKEPEAVIATRKGVFTDHAKKLRIEMKESFPGPVALSLEGDDSEFSRSLLDELKGKVPWQTVYSRRRVSSEHADNLRKAGIFDNSHAVAESLDGVHTDQAYDLMEMLLIKEPMLIAIRLRRDNSERAQEIRNKIEKRAYSDLILAVSLGGVTTEEAQDMRERILRRESKANSQAYLDLAEKENKRIEPLLNIEEGKGDIDNEKGDKRLFVHGGSTLNKSLLKELYSDNSLFRNGVGLDLDRLDRGWNDLNKKEILLQSVVVRGLEGVFTERAQKIRRMLLAIMPGEVAESLSGSPPQYKLELAELLLYFKDDPYVLASLLK
ncbi:MAG: hypothetical protein V1744_04460 [Candidatus Altiarchaeota archaeon]